MSEKLTEELLELMRRCGYSEKVAEYFKNKVNMGRIENPNWVSDHTGSYVDTLQIYLKINNDITEERARMEPLKFLQRLLIRNDSG